MFALPLLGTSTVFAQQTPPLSEPLRYFNEGGQIKVFTHSMPTPWFGIRMTPEAIADVDSAYFSLGITRNVPSTKRDTLEIRVLRNSLPSIQILHQISFEIAPNFQGQFPDAYYIAEFIYGSPVARIDPEDDFWLTWRLKGLSTDQARIRVKQPAANPTRSVILNTNGTTVLATDFMRQQLGLGATDSIDLWAEARVFYPYGIPVELVSFSGNYYGGRVQLDWITATEENNHGFEIHRLATSTQAGQMKLWESIGFVQGHGTSKAEHRYSFVDDFYADAVDNEGVVRYRLRQLDFDGTSALSHTVEVHIPRSLSAFHLEQNFPNPVSTRDAATTLRFSIPTEQHVRIELFDALGRLLLTSVDGVYSAGMHAITIPVSTLRPGSYHYRLSSATGTLHRRLIVHD